MEISNSKLNSSSIVDILTLRYDSSIIPNLPKKTWNDFKSNNIILNTKLSPINTTAFWKSTLFWSLLGLPIMLMFLAFLLKRFILERKEDSVSSKQREAQRLAKKYLSSAKKAFEDQVVFYEALERALHNYLKAKLQIETTELTKDKIERLLLNKKVNKQTALDFVAVIENCELARYAPGSSVSIKVDYEKASSVIASIDRQL